MTRPPDPGVNKRIAKQRAARRNLGWHEVRVWVPTKEDAREIQSQARGMRDLLAGSRPDQPQPSAEVTTKVSRQFVTVSDIKALAQDLDMSLVESQLFGMEIEYYVLLDGDQTVCGVPAAIIGARSSGEADAPFYVDLVVESPVEGVFTIIENVFVNSLTVEHRKTGDSEGVALCMVKDTERVIEIINAPRFGDGLKIVK
jgi:hypothetical protein